MSDWGIGMRSGLRLLKAHKVHDAVSCLQKAADTCPVEESDDLYTILYFLGAALKKSGMTSCAVKSWEAAKRLRPRSNAAHFVRRFTNGYGNLRGKNSIEDDWTAFYSIHLRRYLRGKRTGKLGSVAERDMILDLIRDAWAHTIDGIRLESLNVRQKLDLFKSVEIVFPFFTVPIERDTPLIEVDFGEPVIETANKGRAITKILPFMDNGGHTGSGRIPPTVLK